MWKKNDLLTFTIMCSQSLPHLWVINSYVGCKTSCWGDSIGEDSKWSLNITYWGTTLFNVYDIVESMAATPQCHVICRNDAFITWTKLLGIILIVDNLCNYAIYNGLIAMLLEKEISSPLAF